MKCNYCGKEFYDGNVCPNCGAAIQNNAPASQPSVQNQYSSGVSGVTSREIIKCIIFSIITCGIYGILWFISLTDDVNTLAQDSTATSGGKAFLFTLITCGIYGFYWAYKQGERIDNARTARGLAPVNQGVLYIILNFIGLSIVAYALMQNEINKLA